MKITLSVPSRVHMTLIELGQRGYRRNGGVGFTVEAPERHLEFATSPTFELARLKALGFTDVDVAQLDIILSKAKRECHLPDAITLTAATGPGRHVGTGSGTAVTLACLDALFSANQALVERTELIRMSGRGGTSGIGIHTYFDGGFVADVGRHFDEQTIMSSDDIRAPTLVPQLLARYPLPSWRIGFLFPSCKPLTADQERAVFASLTTEPISAPEVHEIAYHSICGAAAAVAASDFGAFCTAVNALQRTAWKRREIAAHGESVGEIMNRMRELGCDCVGLSSMGPGLYFLAANFEPVLDRLRRGFADANIVSTVTTNRGREIRYA